MRELFCIVMLSLFACAPIPAPPLPPVATVSATPSMTETQTPTPSLAQPTPTPDPNRLYCQAFIYDGTHLMCGNGQCNLAAGDRECHSGGCSCSAQH